MDDLPNSSVSEIPVARLARADGSVEGQLDQEGLKLASIRGVAVNISAQALKLVLQFAYQLCIARLLAPRDLGLAALAAPVIAFVQLFADLGLSQATIQRKSISEQHLSLLFWVSTGLGLTLAIVTFAAAPLVGLFYKDNQVVPVVAAYGSLFILGGLYGQPLALLNRRLRFTSLAFIELLSFAAGAVAGLLGAAAGMGVWALVANSMITSIMILALAWSFAAWRPTRPAITGARDLFQFGGNLTAFNTVNFFARNLDNVLVGRFSGVVNLAYYDRAYKLCLLPFSQIGWPFSRVAGPVLARTVDNPELYRRAYSQLVQTMLLLTIPTVLFAIVASDTLIQLALGSRWGPIGPIFRILALDALMAPISASFGWIFVSQGRTSEMRNAGVVTSLTFVLSFLIGVLVGGPIGVASGYVIAGFFEMAMLAFVISRTGPVDRRTIFGFVTPNAVAGAVTMAGLMLARPLLAYGLIGLAGLGAASYVLFALILCAFPSGRSIIALVINHARLAFQHVLPARYHAG